MVVEVLGGRRDAVLDGKRAWVMSSASWSEPSTSQRATHPPSARRSPGCCSSTPSTEPASSRTASTPRSRPPTTSSAPLGYAPRTSGGRGTPRRRPPRSGRRRRCRPRRGRCVVRPARCDGHRTLARDDRRSPSARPARHGRERRRGGTRPWAPGRALGEAWPRSRPLWTTDGRPAGGR